MNKQFVSKNEYSVLRASLWAPAAAVLLFPVLCHATNSTVAPAPSLPLAFERNLGQAPTEFDFVAHSQAGAFGLSSTGVLLSSGSSQPVRMNLLDSNAHATGSGEAPLTGKVNYYVGSDPVRWQTGVPTFGKVFYRDVYPGVDLVYYGNDQHLEYDFVVAPGADIGSLGLSISGADRIETDSRGALTIGQGDKAFRFDHPIAYQIIGGKRHTVQSSYRVNGHTVQFSLGRYDHSRPLTIDPVLSYFSYLGGSGNDIIGSGTPQTGLGASGYIGSQAAGLNGAGELYVTGSTSSTNFPTQSPVAPAPSKTSGTSWAFITKFAADAKTVVFSTYLGGTNGNDFGFGIALDANGNAFVAGETGSSDFPTTAGAYLRICSPTYVNSPNNPFSGCGNNNGNESFLAKLSPAGVLMASTFLGGTHTLSGGMAVAVDSHGRPYLAGSALPGENTPTGIGGTNETVGFQTTSGAIVAAYPYIANVPVNGALQYDAYVAVFDPTLTTLVYSTLFGDDRPQNGSVPFTSQQNTFGTAVTVDAGGNFYLAGITSDTYLPMTSGAYEANAAACGPLVTASGTTSLGGRCGFVAKFSPVGGSAPPSLRYATYLGGEATAAHSSWEDDLSGIAADSAGDAYVIGRANSAGFPTTTGAYQTTCDGYDNATNTGNYNCGALFIAKLNPSGSTLLAGTYFGCATCSGDAVSTVGAVALDASNNVYVSGFGGNGLPVVNGITSTNSIGGQGPFIAAFDPNLATLKFSSFVNVGNAGQINTSGLAIGTAGALYLAGSTNAPSSSAATSGAFQSAYGGGSSDGFVAKLIVTEATKTTLVVSPTTATTGTQVTFTATVAETAGSGTPTGSVTFKNGTATLGSGSLNGLGMASFSSTTFAAGTYSVVASYGGDALNSVSTSSATSLTVSAPAAPTVTVSVSPTSITQGASATLTWSSTNATSCTASGAWTGSEASSGTLKVTPTSTGSLTYTLACSGAGGTTSKSATLQVNAAPAPTVTVSVSPTSITQGASATLSWSSTNATSCTASGNWSGSEATSGSMTVTPASAGTDTYQLACTGTGGTTTATATLSVTAQSSGGHHGGGGLDWWVLIGLTTLALHRLGNPRQRAEAWATHRLN